MQTLKICVIELTCAFGLNDFKNKAPKKRKSCQLRIRKFKKSEKNYYEMARYS